MKTGFDNALYLQEQSEEILKRAKAFDNKLYLEFGGKLSYDYHAARILPGFDPNVKLQLLQRLKDKIDVVICIYSGDIERKKIRADFGIAYDADTLLIIDNLREWGVNVKAVVVTRYDDHPAVNHFIKIVCIHIPFFLSAEKQATLKFQPPSLRGDGPRERRGE